MALVLALSPSVSEAAKNARLRGGRAVSLSAPGSLGSFTPAASDPKMAAAFARSGFGTGGFGSSSFRGGFRFTPSAAPGAKSRAVTVAIRARAATKAEAERSAAVSNTTILPSAYNLGVAVGWKRFALSGDIARVDSGPITGGRQSLDVGVSYSANRWSTKLQLGADRPVGSLPRLVDPAEGYSADLSGSYSLTRNIAVTGGVRYRLQRDSDQRIQDERHDSQAVYVGTAFKF